MTPAVNAACLAELQACVCAAFGMTMQGCMTQMHRYQVHPSAQGRMFSNLSLSASLKKLAEMSSMVLMCIAGLHSGSRSWC